MVKFKLWPLGQEQKSKVTEEQNLYLKAYSYEKKSSSNISELLFRWVSTVIGY